MTLESVDFSTIIPDGRRLRSGPHPRATALKQGIFESGLLTPLLICKVAGVPHLLAGFGRYDALLELAASYPDRFQAVPCKVWKEYANQAAFDDDLKRFGILGLLESQPRQELTREEKLAELLGLVWTFLTAEQKKEVNMILGLSDSAVPRLLRKKATPP